MGLLLLTLKTISGILISIVIDFFLLDRNGANKVSCLQSDIKIAFNCIESWCMEVKGALSLPIVSLDSLPSLTTAGRDEMRRKSL